MAKTKKAQNFLEHQRVVKKTPLNEAGIYTEYTFEISGLTSFYDVVVNLVGVTDEKVIPTLLESENAVLRRKAEKNAQDAPCGTYQEFDENGTLREDWQYDNGKLDGPYTLYYRDGTPYIEGHYEQNTLHGTFRAYRPDGTLQTEGIYIHGTFTENDSTRIGQDTLHHKLNRSLDALGLELQ